MTKVSLHNISKSFDGRSKVVDDINLEVEPGEFLVLVGPSGCGKSTVLRMVAGLESISSGELRFDDAIINNVEPAKRDVGMVFQNYALYPHLSVRENIAFPLRVRKQDAGTIEKRVDEVAATLSITHLLDRLPKQLSGGQRQRVAVGRAIARIPRLFLFDEPLSNLDANLRVEMRSELSALQKRAGTTAIYVTHDHTEAMTMGDRIAVMRESRIVQTGTPEQLYNNPQHEFVAGFLGSPRINFFYGKLSHSGHLCFEEENGGMRINLPDSAVTTQNLDTTQRVCLAVRAENIRMKNGDQSFSAKVTACEYLGHEGLVYFSTGSSHKVSRADASSLPTAGSECQFMIDTRNVFLFGASGERL